MILVHKVKQEMLVSSSCAQVTEGMWGEYVLIKATKSLTLLIMFGAHSFIEPAELALLKTLSAAIQGLSQPRKLLGKFVHFFI